MGDGPVRAQERANQPDRRDDAWREFVQKMLVEQDQRPANLNNFVRPNRLPELALAENGRDLLNERERSPEYFLAAEKLAKANELLDRKDRLEAKLPDDRKDELRRLRRDLAAATDPARKVQLKEQIDKAFPQLAALQLEASREFAQARSINTWVTEPSRGARPYQFQRMSTIHCHGNQQQFRPPETRTYDPLAVERSVLSNRLEEFYRVRPEDRFEAVWQRTQAQGLIIKLNEALKHMPPLKVSFDRAEDVGKMLLVISGQEPNAQDTRMLMAALKGVKSIEKKEGGIISIQRDTPTEVRLPQERDVAAGIKVRGIELGNITLRLAESGPPRFQSVEGITVKLTVPALLQRVGGISTDVPVRQIGFEPTGDGGWTLYATVDNPIPPLQRKAASFLSSDVPQEDRIKVPLFSVDKDGKAR